MHLTMGTTCKMADQSVVRATRSYLEKRAALRRDRLHVRYLEAQRQAVAIVDRVARLHHPRRIYQWGSLLDERHFNENSDIDLALEGLVDAAQFFAVVRDAETLTDMPLDIVELEKVDPLQAESIRRRGRLVYERT